MKPNNRLGDSSRTRPVVEDATAPAKLVEASGDLEPRLVGESLDSSYTPMPPKKRSVWRRPFSMALLGIGLLGALLLAVHTMSVNKQTALSATPVDKSAALKPQSIPLANLGLKPIDLLPESASQITVNGSVNIADSLVLSPSTTPTGAVAGQLYFDGARNQLAYYNGSSYVYLLQPGSGASVTNNSVVNNITNVTNNITNGTTNGITASGAVAGSLAMFTGSSTLGSSLINQNGSTVNVAGNFEVNGTPLSSSTLADNANLAKLNASQTFTGANTFENAANSPTAFVIQDANGSALWTADTANRVLTAGGNLIVNTPSSCNYASYVSYMKSLNPLGYWTLDDSGTTAADSSGNNDTGTLNNVSTGITPGPISCGASHSGMGFTYGASGSAITTGTTMPAPSTYSEVAMFKTSNVWDVITGFTDGGGNGGFNLGVNINGQLYEQFWNPSLGWQTVTGLQTVNDGQWHVAVGTVSAAGTYLYLDGNLIASNASFTTPQIFAGHWEIGNTINSNAFGGDIAQVAVTNYALSAQQVANLSAISGFYTTNLASLGLGTTTPGANLDDAGSALFHDANNSASAFQVQTKQGDNLLNVDTSGNTVNVGATGSTPLSSTVNIGTSDNAANAQTVTVGSTASSSTAVVQGGTGGVSINTGAVAGISGGISITSGASSTTAAGDVNIDTGSSIINGTVVENDTFETGLDDMVDGYGHGDTLSTTTAVAHSGTSSFQITEGAFWGNWAIGEGAPYPTNTIIPGHTYRFSAWVRAATVPRSITFQVDWSDDGFGGGGSVGTGTWGTVTDTTTGWTQVSGTLVAPVNAWTEGIFAFSNGTGGTQGEVHYIDDITVTDLNNLTATAELNLGTTNAQEVNLGNANQTGATTVYGTGLNFEAGLGYITEAGGFFTLSGTLGGNISTAQGPLTITSATSASWGISGSGGTGGDLTLHGGQAGGSGNTGGNLILESGAGSGAGSSGAVQITSPSGSGTSGAISIQSGDSSTTAAGNVSVDTGHGTVNGVQAEALDFESGIENMGMWGGSGSVTQDCTQAHTGSCSLNITGFSSVSAWENGGDVGWTVTPGHLYAFSFWVKAASTAEPVSGAISWHMTDGNWTWSSSPTITDTSTGWTQVTWTATAPAGAQFGDFELGNIDGPGTTHYFDDVVATDMSSGSALSSLNLGTSNAQGVNIGNVSQINPTTINGGGISLSAGQGNLDISGGATTITAASDASFTSTGGVLTLSGAGGSGAGVVVVPIADSTTAFVVQRTGGAAVLSVDTQGSIVTVVNLVATGNLTVDGHLITGGNTPTIAAGAAACTTPTVSISGNDTSGTITINTGTGCTGGGTLATITFASHFGAAPTVVLTPGSPISQTLGAYVDDSTISTTSFDLGTNATPLSSQTFKWNYFVVQ